MSRPRALAPSPEQVALVRWTASLGAVTAGALAEHQGSAVPSARARLGAAARAGLLARSAPLAAAPSLYTVTPGGLRACGLRGPRPARVTPANAAHAVACAVAAAALERIYPDHRVLGEPELRLQERRLGAPLAGASLGAGPGGGRRVHRPDLVLLPEASSGRRPIAVEVELTVKAPARLLGICRGWARNRRIAGVLYLTPPEVAGPLARAIRRAGGGAHIVVVPLAALHLDHESGEASRARDGRSRAGAGTSPRSAGRSREPSPSAPSFADGGSKIDQRRRQCPTSPSTAWS
ncbi:MAG TPA: hypothetical protein VKG62_07290 [Solirubrobacteraceae bacterium]|nr:hypothetical protein [Solirubrobacteraceae bacterium]